MLQKLDLCHQDGHLIQFIADNDLQQHNGLDLADGASATVERPCCSGKNQTRASCDGITLQQALPLRADSSSQAPGGASVS